MQRLGIDMQTVFGLAPVDQVKLAAELACGHVSTGLAPVPWKLERFPVWSLHDPSTRRDLKNALLDYGVRLSVVEGFAVRPEAEALDRRADLDIAAELGAERASTVCIERDPSRGLEQLAQLAELTSERGMMLTLEFAPPHGINTLEGALAAIEAIGRPNVALVIDAMHFFRSGATINELAQIASSRIGYAQLCDAPWASEDDDYYREACFNRMCPGDGQLPLRQLAQALPADIPIGIETPMQAELLAASDLRAPLARLVAGARRVLLNH